MENPLAGSFLAATVAANLCPAGDGHGVVWWDVWDVPRQGLWTCGRYRGDNL